MIAMTLSPGRSINANLLPVFVLVAEHLSFKEAAKRTARSQSAVSAQIRQLEDQLSVPLFHRTTRAVTLTIYGEILLETARKSIHELNQGVCRLRDAAEGDVGRIVMTCSPSIAGTILPPLLMMYRAKDANVNIEVTEAPSFQMIEPILAGRFAFGIGPVFPGHDGLVFDPLVEDPFVALIPRSMPQSELPAISLDELAKLPLLMPTKDSATRRILEATALEAGITFTVNYECIQYRTLIAMVEAGLGVTVLPVSTIDQDRPQAFRAVPIDSPRTRRQIAIISATDRVMPLAARKLVTLIKHEIRDWARAGKGRLPRGLIALPAPVGGQASPQASSG